MKARIHRIRAFTLSVLDCDTCQGYPSQWEVLRPMTTTTRTERRRTVSIRHETRALLRAHLSAAAGYRHLTRHCPVCHRLLRLVQEAGDAGEPPRGESPSFR